MLFFVKENSYIATRMRNILYILFVCLLVACGKREAVTPILQEAERVMNAHPDSALAWSLYYDGISHYELNEFLPSQIALLDAEAVATTIPDHALLGRIYENLGNIYKRQGLRDSVIPMLKKALEEKVLAKDSLGIGITYQHIARTILAGDLDSAEFYYKQALPWLKNINYYLYGFYNDLGILYRQKEEYEHVIHYIKQSFALHENGKGDINALYLSLGNAYYKMGQLDSAIVYYQRCVNDPKTGTSSHGRLAQIYEQLGDYKTAYTYKSRYMTYRDSIYKSQQAAALATQLKEREKDKLQQRNTELRWQKQQSIYIGCIVVLSLLLLLFWGYRYYRRLLARKEKQLVALEQIKRQNQIYISHKEEEIARLEKLILSNENQNTQLIAEKETLQKELEEYKQNSQCPEDMLYFRLQKSPFPLSKDQWGELLTFTNQYHGAFINRITEAYPLLSSTDLLYCCLIRLGFTKNEMATILNVNTDSITTWKWRVCKSKFNIDRVNIQTFLRLF